jgi:maltose alpha-D-glucosyltransferase/alpha-amylase
LAFWVRRVRLAMDALFERLLRALPDLPDAARAAAALLLAARAKLYRRIVRTAAKRLEARKTRCHGNFHLGQVWLVNNDVLIANYGGEPGQSWEERRRKHTPLFDVAGLSFALAEIGMTALAHADAVTLDIGSVRVRQVRAWELLARKAFFRSYRSAMTGHPSYPAEVAAAESLMNLFLMERAISLASRALDRNSPNVAGALLLLVQLAQR